MNIPDPPHCPDLYLPLTNGSGSQDPDKIFNSVSENDHLPAIVAGGGDLGDIVSDPSRRSICKTDLDKNKKLTMN
jgi:hypothetical protein